MPLHIPQRILKLATCALIAGACSPGPNGADPDRPAAADTDSITPASSESVCMAGDRFVADGAVLESAGPGDARQVAALRWESHDGCERFVVDLQGEDGTAADRAGPVTARVLRDQGVVRVSLRDVRTVDTDATDATFDGPLANAAYVVRSPDGQWLDVDLHLAGAAEASVMTLDSPARIVVDLRPGGSPLPQPAPRTNLIVVLAPRAGNASYPLHVTGYARTFEANVVLRIEQNGRDVEERFTTSTGWVDAWGAWSFDVDTGPAGDIVLHVGEYSARDGEWQGVAVPLVMSRP